MHQMLIEICAEIYRAREIRLERPIETGAVPIDSTCQEANINYPTDWALLRDVPQTLLKATILIRKAGQCQRMWEEPGALFVIQTTCVSK